MLRILSYGLPDPGHRVLTAHNGMSKKLRNGQKGPERPYGYRSRLAPYAFDRGYGALVEGPVRLISAPFD